MNYILSVIALAIFSTISVCNAVGKIVSTVKFVTHEASV
jgi:hypothetical protein